MCDRLGKDAFSKDIPLRQIAKALKDPDQCTAAALSLEKHLCKVVAEGNKNFQKYLKESAQDELQMDALLPALAETVSQYPCHLPALASLGMFAFSGVPKLFQSIQETGCIPATSKGDILNEIINTISWLNSVKLSTIDVVYYKDISRHGY